jgi:hypothetical protein
MIKFFYVDPVLPETSSKNVSSNNMNLWISTLMDNNNEK